MLVSMVHSNREKQQETLWTLVKVLLRGRLMTENQRCPSLKSLAALMKNRLLTGRETSVISSICGIALSRGQLGGSVGFGRGAGISLYYSLYGISVISPLDLDINIQLLSHCGGAVRQRFAEAVKPSSLKEVKSQKLSWRLILIPERKRKKILDFFFFF